MVTRAKRASNNKWDAENMVVLGCKVRKDLAEEFRQACREAGTSPNAVFRAALEDFLLKETGSSSPDAGEEA